MPPSLNLILGVREIPLKIKLGRSLEIEILRQHVEHVGEEGELGSDEEDSDLHLGDPNLTQLVMTEEEQRDHDSFALALPSVQDKKGKNPFMEGFPGES